MKFRRLRKPLSVSAARMTVRTHVPLGLKVAFGCVAAAAAIATGVVLARLTAPVSPLVEQQPGVARLVDENRVLRQERDRLLEASNTIDSRGLMERSTIQELGNQVATLQAENTRLKEDVAFFEAATAGRTPSGALDAVSGIAIRRFQVTQDRASHTARYRILLTQDAKAAREFNGVLQLQVTVQQDGRSATFVLPQAPTRPAAADALNVSRYDVVFKSYKRIDGSFDVPAEAVLRTVQARILERGAVRVQQTATVE